MYHNCSHFREFVLVISSAQNSLPQPYLQDLNICSMLPFQPGPFLVPVLSTIDSIYLLSFFLNKTYIYNILYITIYYILLIASPAIICLMKADICFYYFSHMYQVFNVF